MSRHTFTLAEVLVAALITAIVIPVALRALLTVGDLDQSVRHRQQAVRLADLKIRELTVTGDWADGESRGDFGVDHPGFTWELTSETVTFSGIAMRRLDVMVTAPGRAGRGAVNLTTLVAEAD